MLLSARPVVSAFMVNERSPSPQYGSLFFFFIGSFIFLFPTAGPVVFFANNPQDWYFSLP